MALVHRSRSMIAHATTTEPVPLMRRYFNDSLIRAHSANRSWIWARKQAWTISAIARYEIYSNLTRKRSVKRTTCSIATAVWVITAIWPHERVLFLTESLLAGKKAYWINGTAAVIPHKGKYLYISLTNGLMQLTVVWSGILQNDIKSLEEWKHVPISQNSLDTDILAIEDSILSQTLLTFRQRQEDIVSFIMCKSQWNLRWLSCLAREEKKLFFLRAGKGIIRQAQEAIGSSFSFTYYAGFRQVSCG